MDVLTVKGAVSGESKNSNNATEKALEPRKHRERSQITSMISSSSFLLTPQEGDSTFEPTIDMIVNDFDDEQTLNEEEALAASEQQNPQDEISTLKEEGEMPLEELLAKYQALPCTTSHYAKKLKKKSKYYSGKKSGKCDSNVTAAEEIDKPHTNNDLEINNETDGKEIGEQQQDKYLVDLENDTVGKLKHSYLLDLYPDEIFSSPSLAPQEIYSVEEDEAQTESEREADTDPDYVKKTIMVGLAYQAVIPAGLSQYGDVLPYENEDKLIWEPSQVSEQEVEKYLLMARDINTKLREDETNSNMRDKENEEETNKVMSSGSLCSTINNGNYESLTKSSDQDSSGVVKDNEQALLLLVQCGYDFKEALRRKRLNAVPLTGSMSIWSEEECKNFEEGIQKYGKDFLRIRQTNVRTRTMRELVLFYYLWKKSERRDHEFANADTVDHMDIYLNENRNLGSSSAAGNSFRGGFSAQSMLQQNGRINLNNICANNSQKIISIMTTSQSSHSLKNSLKIGSNRKRNSISNNVVTSSSTASMNVDTKQNEFDIK